MLFTLVFWLCSLILLPRKLRAGSFLIWMGLVGLTIAGWVSIFDSVDPILSCFAAFRLLVLLFFYLYIVNEIKLAKWIVIPIALQNLIQSVVVILQVNVQSSLGWDSLGELTLDPQNAGISVVFGDGFRFLRGYGLGDHPNIVGGCIAFGLALLLPVVFYEKKTYVIAASIVFFPSLLALILTFSRAAWLSFVAAGCFLFGVETLSHRKEPVKRGVILGVISLLLIYPFIKNNSYLFESRINSGDIATDPPMFERAFLLQSGNTLFVEHSAIGIGIGATPLALKNRFENFPVSLQPPHYTILTVALETGVLGGMFYFLLVTAPILTFLFRWKVLSQQPFVVGSLVLLIAVTVVGFFDYYTWSYQYGRVWQWLGWGIWSVALEKTS